MKKLLCVLITSVLSIASFTAGAAADEAPRALEVLYPERVYLATARSLVADNPLIISDVATTADSRHPGASKDSELYAVLESATEDGFTYPVSRRFHTYSFDTKSDIASDKKVTLEGNYLAFRMKNDWDGTRAYKRPFTWEFDFTVSKLDNYFSVNIGSAHVMFKKDSAEEDKFYLTWYGGGESDISGEQLEFGKTYHIRIEADLTAGAGVFAVFSDPDTEYVNTSYKEHGVNYSDEVYATTSNCCKVAFECTGNVEITTQNENMFYESYFIRAHEITSGDDGSAVTASATVLNALDKARSSVPYLFLGIYDENGCLVSSVGSDEGTPAKASSELSTTLTSSPYQYSVKIDASSLDDGNYTAKSALWRDDDITYVQNEVIEQSFSVADGVITINQ